jgi:hypothetical protein
VKQVSLALLILFLVAVAAYGQSVARAKRPSETESLISQPGTEAKDNDQSLAASSIAALKRLNSDVLVYRSLGDFEANGRLARVSFEAFTDDLSKVTAELEPMLSRLPQGRLKTEILNALDSYRDGAFWWQKIHQSRVVSVSTLYLPEINRTPPDLAFLATVPYTVAIHWRQADRYLKRAQEMMNGTRN